MTRETKIGLLVGLAFIIVIGILLSDHLTSSNEPPQAALGGAGNGAREAVGSPGAGGTNAPITVITPQVITPQQPVATQAEVTTPTPAVQIVKIGGPAETVAASPTPEPVEKVDSAKDKPEADAPLASNNNPVVVTPASNPPVATDSELAKVAEAHGEQLVNVDDGKAAAGSAQAYVAQPGDSLSKIAAKFFGSGTKTNRDLIVKANPSLQANENMIIAGKTYQIPAANKAAAKAKIIVARADSAATPTDNTTPSPDSNTDAPKQEKPANGVADAGYLYTVQPGDNLTKIARDEIGDIHAVAAIQELNTDKLKGDNHDIVIAGSKLRLPGKPLARAE
jgi:LysM repeat protein